MTAPARVLATLATAALLTSTSGCSSDSSAETDKDAGEKLSSVADQSTCLADATAAATPWPDAFPGDWPFPGRTTAYHVEDRGTDGIIVTAVTGSAFKDVLAFMNEQVVDAGYEVESGETEEHDAEAEWTGNGYHGRWAIRESAQCPGETVIQVLSTH